MDEMNGRNCVPSAERPVCHGTEVVAGCPPADLTLERIGDLLDYDLSALLAANNIQISIEVKP